MKKLAFLFPGVGSHYIGMSKSLYDNFSVFKETIEEAADILKQNLFDMCFLPEKKEELNKLENSQAALLAFSIATYRVYMQEIGIPPDYCLGYSLGEYSALCCGGAIQFPDALRLVKERGFILNEVASALKGTMAWVINLDTKIVENVCRKTSQKGQEIYVSSYDSPIQASISGNTQVLMKVAKELEKQGAIVYPLQLSGPFHSPLMKEASEKMTAILRNYNFGVSQYPVIANHNALPYNDKNRVRNNLTLQLISPIYWRASVEYLLKQNLQVAIEMGPKDVLKFLIKKITNALRVYTMDTDRDLELLSKQLISIEELKAITRPLDEPNGKKKQQRVEISI